MGPRVIRKARSYGDTQQHGLYIISNPTKGNAKHGADPAHGRVASEHDMALPPDKLSRHSAPNSFVAAGTRRSAFSVLLSFLLEKNVFEPWHMAFNEIGKISLTGQPS